MISVILRRQRRFVPVLVALIAVCAMQTPAFSALDEGAMARVEAAERRRVELIQKIMPTVISVFRVDGEKSELTAGSGSGVIISPDGYALSNFHVTETNRNLRVGLVGGRTFSARLLGLDRTGDIALMKIEADQPLPYAELGSSEQLQVGQWVIAMGNPFLLATDFSPTVSMGVVSGLHRYLPGGGALRKDLIYADAIQIDAALNPGNSGGPLFNMQGQLIGINGRIAPRRLEGMRLRKLNAGIGFAIPIDAIKRFLADLKAGHEVDRGYLGIQDVDECDEGLKVSAIVAESPAEIFGIRKDDILVSIDGQTFRDLGDIKNFVQTRPAGMRVEVVFQRGDEIRTQQVQLGGVQAVALLKLAEMANARGARLTPPRPPTEDDENDGDGDEEDQEEEAPSPETPPDGDDSPQKAEESPDDDPQPHEDGQQKP